MFKDGRHLFATLKPRWLVGVFFCRYAVTQVTWSFKKKKIQEGANVETPVKTNVHADVQTG